MLVLIETFYSDSNFDDIRLYEKLVKCSTRLSRNITYLISQNINIHGMLPIHSSHCPGFGGFLCVASLEPIKPYKYSFLIHIFIPMTMLSLNHPNHKLWPNGAIFLTVGMCNEHGTIYAISSDFGDSMTTQSM